jgi:hypothetical protein
MKTIFYLFSILFIWVEIFQMRNRIRLHLIEVQRIDPIKWILFYISKIAYFFWIFLGLFTSNYLIFTFLLALGLPKFLLVKIKKDFYINLYDLISCIISIFILLYITYLGVVQ